MPASESRIQVAVCEDHDALRNILVSVLPEYGLRFFGVPSAEALDRLMAERQVDLVVLDIGLPGEDGFSAASRLRLERPGLGIVMLTARALVADRVHGLNLGADLYFVKPVDIEELAAALVSLHRRLSPLRAPRTLRWTLAEGETMLETPEGSRVGLTANEGVFLSAVMRKPGTPLERRDLFEALGWASSPLTDKRLETLVSRLRNKVSRAAPGTVFPLRTIHAVGYAFKEERDL